jgi:hypothetical protein
MKERVFCLICFVFFSFIAGIYFGIMLSNKVAKDKLEESYNLTTIIHSLKFDLELLEEQIIFVEKQNELLKTKE